MLKKTWISLAFAGLLTAGSLSADVIVNIAPPPPIVEAPPPPPGPAYVWVAGYYRWDGRGSVWVPGHWEIPPRPHARWHPHHWRKRHGAWVFVEGYWR
jgi:hypothetical protein